MSILLHQSGVILGINISLADFFCMYILFYIILSKNLTLPIAPLLFFLIVTVLVLIAAVFFIPYFMSINIHPRSILSDYIKLVAIFVYFIVGFNIAKLNLIEKLMKSYTIFGIFIGIIGLLSTILNIRLFSQLYYGGTRFKGLMIDPNYFSVIQITALVFISRSHILKNKYKVLAELTISFSILASGSKTGAITLFIYLILRILEIIIIKKKKLSLVILHLFFIVLIISLFPVYSVYLKQLINLATGSVPSLERVSSLFTDFGEAISEGGSGRDTTWKVALQVIQSSPFIGVGIGTYTSYASEMFNYNNVAHNTYLQLAAEWGIPLTIMIFSYIFFLLIKSTKRQILVNNEIPIILRDIIIVLLIGSLSISLNNARILWLCLGAMAFLMGRKGINNDEYKTRM